MDAHGDPRSLTWRPHVDDTAPIGQQVTSLRPLRSQDFLEGGRPNRHGFLPPAAL